MQQNSGREDFAWEGFIAKIRERGMIKLDRKCLFKNGPFHDSFSLFSFFNTFVGSR